MKLNWEIRPAMIEDASGLHHCMQAAYEIYQERMQGERLPPLNIDYAKEISDYPAWVVDCKDQIIGGLIMVFEDDYASIANIAVDPQHQGKGVGSSLIKFAVKEAREQNFMKIRLATHILLTENLSMYRHLGWEETGRDSVRVIMERDI